MEREGGGRGVRKVTFGRGWVEGGTWGGVYVGEVVIHTVTFYFYFLIMVWRPFVCHYCHHSCGSKV